MLEHSRRDDMKSAVHFGKLNFLLRLLLDQQKGTFLQLLCGSFSLLFGKIIIFNIYSYQEVRIIKVLSVAQTFDMS